MLRIRIIIIILFSIVLSSCSSRIIYDGVTVKNWKVASGNKNFNATFTDFSRKAYQIANFKKEEVNINIASEIEKGIIKFI